VVWEATLLPVLAAQIWATVLTLDSVSRLYPKISGFAAELFFVFAALSAISCCAGLYFETRLLTGSEAILRSFFLLDRWVHTLLAGTLVLTMIFFACFPSPVRKRPANLFRHTLLLSLYFSAYALYFLSENLAPLGDLRALDYTKSALVISLYIAWTCLLSPAGERKEEWPGIELNVLQAIEQQNQNALALLRYAATGK
jgi:hypothetical protein